MNCDIRFVVQPTEWPVPPKRMSFSTLKSIESCPLRWALIHSRYTDLWPGTGYPIKASVAAIIGQVIHDVVEMILKDAASLGDGSFQARLMATVRNHGGLTKLIDLSLTRVTDVYLRNPRMTALVEKYRTGRLRLPPKVRTSVQSLLQKIARMETAAIERTFSPKNSNEKGVKILPNGLYTEIALYASNTNWYGKIDLLSITENDIAIEDIKTGTAKDADREQLQIYAWLWWRDIGRNPNGRLPTRLRIRYLDSSVDIPVPDESELLAFENYLLNRSVTAIAEVAGDSHEARPSADTCRYCEVRHLCDVYWREVVPNEPADASRHGDIEAEFIGMLSARTWQVKVNAGSTFGAGSIVLLRGPLPEKLTNDRFGIRVLDAKFVYPHNDQLSDEMPVVQLLEHSEVFVGPRLDRVGAA